MVSGWLDQTADLVVFDLETTGLFPGGHDRVIELAAIRYDPKGREIDRIVTLVDCQRDVGPTHIHGIKAEHILGAPTFDLLVGDIAQVFAGAVPVAHNLSFDWRFLESEFSRAGIDLPPTAGLCTMRLPGVLGLRLPDVKLRTCAERFGIPFEPEQAHGAEHDAEVAALLFFHLLKIAAKAGRRTQDRISNSIALPPAELWPQAPVTKTRFVRSEAWRRSSERFGFLATIASRVSTSGVDAAIAPYIDLLGRVLEDHVVSEIEVQHLVQLAGEIGLSRDQVDSAHAEYLDALIREAWSDGILSHSEIAELEAIAYWMGIEPRDLALRVDSLKDSGSVDGSHTNPFEGMSVCFSGSMSIPRDEANRLAVKAGLEPKGNVSKKLDLLVLQDPHSQSGKAKKARELGVRIIAADTFLATITRRIWPDP